MKLFIYSMFLPLLPLIVQNTETQLEDGIETTIIRCHEEGQYLVCDDVRYIDDGSDCIKIYGQEGPGSFWSRDCED